MFELLVGATTSTRPNERKSQLSTFLNIVQIINFTTKEADSTAQIKAKLKAKGLNMGPLDLLIAGTALCHDLTLVTNNTKEFSMPGDLKLIDWTK